MGACLRREIKTRTQYTERTRRRLYLLQAIAVLLLVAAFFGIEAAQAHPEDDFCGPDSGIDPELCRELAETNRSDAALSHPLLDEEGEVLSPLSTAWLFLKIGVEHILPGGLDHILFVLALFLASQRLRHLIIQISAFTIAHTATLGLAASGVIHVPGTIVEPLIAASIAFVAVENVYFRHMTTWRPLIVFGFGLLHGLGFAGFIGEVGLPPEQFWSALIGFNIGVEIGQLAVVVVAALISVPLNRVLKRSRYTYRGTVSVPLSLIIAAIGLWWAVTRSLGY